MKVYYDRSSSRSQMFITHSWPLMLESKKWTFTTEKLESNIIPVIGSPNNYLLDELTKDLTADHIILILDLYHSSETAYSRDTLNSWKTFLSNFTEKILVVHPNLLEDVDIYWDITFHRQKLYFTDYGRVKNLDSQIWTYGTNPKVYDLTYFKSPFRKFLSPSRIYFSNHKDTRMNYRHSLKNFLEKFNTEGFISYPEKQFVFLPNNCTYNMMPFIYKLNGEGGTWYPIGNEYYDSTIASIYVETIVEGIEHRIITEKTFDPLIKNHFVLPFSYQGMINDLENLYGFKLPEWIDYSYDDITDTAHRFAKYIESVENFLKLSVDELIHLLNISMDILTHNRQVFFSRPYESLYDLTVTEIEKRNWNL